MKWVTRQDVKVDRVACPWLIKRFIDPNAEFVFLSTDTVNDDIIFDVPGCNLGHHGKDTAFAMRNCCYWERL